jgi:hypothetical protein
LNGTSDLAQNLLAGGVSKAMLDPLETLDINERQVIGSKPNAFSI